jgi:L-lactate dehydrogenase complex protein LldG
VAVTPEVVMSGRDTVMASIRRGLGVSGREAPRRQAVESRIAGHPSGLRPARGQLPPKERLELFVTMVERSAATVARVGALDDVPAVVAEFLRRHNLPMRVQRGADASLAAMPWAAEATLTVDAGPPDPASLAAVSRAMAGITETGTLVLASGPDNPTSLNFLPDNHVVVVTAADVAGDFDTVWARLREKYGESLPRAVNLVTGPSRTADIEQTLVIGAHGPRRLHVVVVGEAE